jgi:hypothetical protein
LQQFRTTYGLLVICFAGLCILAVAWHWSLPKSYATGFPFRRAALMLLGAVVMLNGLSFLMLPQPAAIAELMPVLNQQHYPQPSHYPTEAIEPGGHHTRQQHTKTDKGIGCAEVVPG